MRVLGGRMGLETDYKSVKEAKSGGKLQSRLQ